MPSAFADAFHCPNDAQQLSIRAWGQCLVHQISTSSCDVYRNAPLLPQWNHGMAGWPNQAYTPVTNAIQRTIQFCGTLLIAVMLKSNYHASFAAM